MLLFEAGEGSSEAVKRSVKIGENMKRYCRIFIMTAVLALMACCLAFGAEERSALTATGFGKPASLKDGSRDTYTQAQEGNTVTLSAEDGIVSVYVEFDRLPAGAWTIRDPESGKSADCGGNEFLHDFADVKALLGTAPKTLELSFAQGAYISEIYVFSGQTPDWVQRWEPELEQADLLLLTTHSDDEQLFFAGVLPYYAIERGYKVQVVYFIQYFTRGNSRDHTRPHEQLDGLWTVGIRNYPHISEFPDIYAEGKDREAVLGKILANFAPYGYKYEDFLGYSVEMLRRFKPLVVVDHDLNGEYGHGAHVLNTAVMCDAIELANDPSSYPESAEKYGLWKPEKLYLHLYDQDPIVMDWDTPYESMGGKTPVEMTQEGFRCHKSQHWTWFYRWIYGTSGAPITKASQIKTYSPCNYGLWYSSVGKDEKGGDFFENVMSYAEKKAEAERIAAEEAARKAAEEEAARKKAEEEERARQEAIRQAEEAEAAEKAAKAAKARRIMIACGIVGIVLIAAAAMIFRRPKGRRYRD